MNENIYISYAWAENNNEIDERDLFINSLLQESSKRGVNVLIEREQIDYNKSIKNFMNEIGNGKKIILIISDKYLKSKYCMYEALRILKDENFHNRIYPIVFNDAKIFDALDITNYIEFWNNKSEKLNSKLLNMDSLVHSKPLIDELEIYKDIERLVAKLAVIISDLNTLTPDTIRKTDFNILFDNLSIPRNSVSLDFSIDIAICVDTRMSKKSLSIIKNEFALNFIKTLKNNIEKRQKNVTYIRIKIIELNKKNGLETKFYDIDNPNDYNKYIQKLDSIQKTKSVDIKANKIEQAIKSDWLNFGENNRHIILVFSEHGMKIEKTQFDKLSILWHENEYLTDNEKRLILFAPDVNPWKKITNQWIGGLQYTTKNIYKAIKSDNMQMDTICDVILSIV